MIQSVTIICVLCDRYNPFIQKTIDSVQLSLEASGLDGVVSVIDNSAKPNQIPKHPRRQYTWNQGYNVAQGGAMNQAAKKADTDAIAYICERHTTISDYSWLRDLIDSIEPTNVGMAGNVQPCNFACVAQNPDDIIEPQVHIQGGVWAARRETFNKFKFSYRWPQTFCDVDISRRMIASGLTLANVPSVASVAGGKVDHPERFKIVHDYRLNVMQQLLQKMTVAPFPFDVRGWLSPIEGNALANLSRGKRVMEIGSYCGRSTICIARTADSVLAVDFFDGRATPDPGDTSVEFFKNLETYGVADKVTVAHPDAAIEGPFDLVFIDGNHDRQFVETDIVKSLAVLSPDGLLAFHDYSTEHVGVTEAVNQLLLNGGEVVSRHDSLVVIRPPTAMLPFLSG